MTRTLTISTGTRADLVDLTAQIQDVVRESGISEGTCILYIPHTTAGITINEGADPDVKRDILAHLEKLVPRRDGYRHVEGNADAHIKASLMGCSGVVLIQGGRLALGTWQAIYLAEFDGPRTRKVLLNLQGD